MNASEVPAAFLITEADWSYYDEGKRKWISAVEKGEDITVYVGSSSADLLWNQTLSCKDSKPKAKGSHPHKAKGWHPHTAKGSHPHKAEAKGSKAKILTVRG